MGEYTLKQGGGGNQLLEALRLGRRRDLWRHKITRGRYFNPGLQGFVPEQVAVSSLVQVSGGRFVKLFKGPIATVNAVPERLAHGGEVKGGPHDSVPM